MPPEGGAWGVFLTLAADVAPGRGVADRDRRPGRRAKPKLLERVLHPGASCSGLMPIPRARPGPSTAPAAWAASREGSAGASRSSAQWVNSRSFWCESLILYLTRPCPWPGYPVLACGPSLIIRIGTSIIAPGLARRHTHPMAERSETVRQDQKKQICLTSNRVRRIGRREGYGGMIELTSCFKWEQR